MSETGDIAPLSKITRRTLTPRENQVYDLVIQGKSAKEISAVLGITPRTVKFHLAKIYAKFGVSSRIELILRASASRKI